MNDAAMTNHQFSALRSIARSMGYSIDELGHPYREVPTPNVDGVHCRSLYDFDPYNDPADAFRVQVHFNLNPEMRVDCIVIRRGMAELLTIRHFHQGSNFEDITRQCCIAVCEAAAIYLARQVLDRRANAV